jgi:putative hydrolase of the HAD superfamily
VGGAPFDAVLCDIDGVLRHWPSATSIERAHGLPAGAIAAAAFASARLHPVITGEITDEEWRRLVEVDLAVLSPSAQAAVAAWSALVPRVDRDVLALLRSVRVPVALITNATTRLESDLVRDGLDTFSVISSARVGVAKPDPGIYLFAARRLGVPVRRCLLIDDTPANVVSGDRLGMPTLLYRGVDQLRAALGSEGSPEAVGDGRDAAEDAVDEAGGVVGGEGFD